MRDLTGLATAKDPWIAECEYNVLLRQALQANRERRGLCERLTELVEQMQLLSQIYTVIPTPATHSTWTGLKAGETLYQAGELPKPL